MRRIVKIPLAGVSLVIFLFVLLLYLYFFTSVPEQQLNDWLTYYLSEKIGYRVTVEKMYRDIWRRLKLEDVRVYKVTGDKPVPIGHIQNVELTYSVKDLLFKEYRFDSISVSDIDFSLLPDERLASQADDSADQKADLAVDMPDIVIDNIDIRDVDIQTVYNGEIIDLVVSRLNGSFANDGNMLDLRIDSLTAGCPQIDFDIKNLAAKCFIVDENLMIESINLKTSRSNIALSGQFGKLNEPDIKMAYDLSPFDLGDVSSITGLKLEGGFVATGHVNGNLSKFGGEMTGSGNLFGRSLDNFAVDFRLAEKILFIDSYDGQLFDSPFAGKGYIDFNARPETYSMSGRIKELNLQKIAPDIYSSFSGYFELAGQGFTSGSFHMAIDMELSEADIDSYHFDGARGKIDFDLENLTFLPGFEAYYKDTEVAFDGNLEYNGEINLSGNASFHDLSDFTNQFFVTDLDGTGEADFHVTGPTLDFTVAGGFYSDSCRFYGLRADSFDLDLQLKSFISHKVGRVNGRWSGGDLYTVPVDSGRFSVTVSGEKFFLDSVRVENENNKIDFSGFYDNGTIPPSLVINPARMILWKDTVMNRTPLLIDVYEREIEFQDFKLYSRASSLDMTGIVTYDGKMALDLTAENLEITPIAAYFIQDRVISGLLSGELDIAGDFDSPEFDADIWIHDLSVDSYALGLLNVRAYYENAILSLMPAELESSEGLYTLTGGLPLNLSFTSEEGFLPDSSQLELRLVASGHKLIPASILVESVRSFEADFDIDIEISGTYEKPSARGRYSVSDGQMYVMELVEPLRDINFGGRLVNDKIYIDTLSLYAWLAEDSFTETINKYLRSSTTGEKSRGLITGFGTITILGMGRLDYNLNFTGYNCEFYADGYDTQFLTDLFLKVTGSSPPLVEGWARMKRFEFRDPFAKYAVADEDIEVLEDSTQWDIQLDIYAPNNVWIKNSESIIETEGSADLEMKGDVTLTREKGVLGVLGQFDVVRGYYYLANKKFRIKSGWMTFDNPDTLDPLVYFDVTTRIMNQGDQASYTDLDLVISGRLSNMQIGTSSGSAYSDEDILMLLAQDMVASGESVNLTDNLAFLSQRLFSSIDEFEVIDMIDISREQLPWDESKRATRLTVWKYISPKFLVSYSTRLSQEEAGQTVGFEYIHNDNISFEGYQGTGDQGVSFDVKLRYEF